MEDCPADVEVCVHDDVTMMSLETMMCLSCAQTTPTEYDNSHFLDLGHTNKYCQAIHACQFPPARQFFINGHATFFFPRAFAFTSVASASC